jgi:hypothetical protein
MCYGCELVKAPAKKIAQTNGQPEINQSKHITAESIADS